MPEASKFVNKFRMGCDPEFLLLDKDNKVMSAPMVVRGGQIGYDGALAEIRPSPSISTYELTKNIKAILTDKAALDSPVGQLKWRGGAWFTGMYAANQYSSVRSAGSFPIGGHVHLEVAGIPVQRRTLAPTMTVRRASTLSPVNTMKRALDMGVRCLERLDILPHKEMIDRRTRSGYGRTNDAIRNSCGGLTWEYRRMCSFLFDPNVTFLCLTLAKLIAMNPRATAELLYRPYEFGSIESILGAYAQHDDDARRLHELLWPSGLRVFQADPDADFKPKWQKWSLDKR